MLRAGNPMTRVLMTILIFEAVVFLLAIAGMVQVADQGPGMAVGLGVGSAVLALAAAFTLRRPVGFVLGWLAQAVAVGLGFATPWMFAMGSIFALLWLVTFVLGRRLEPEDA
ncbi:DUF4233 domain-containing protein [Nigerium massiliense]|uniref:DUF4233 domain-containing protein n=1 Tax=Nigerium massiliense TaxID=1522317 RepID=UPI00058F5AF5|nr:DUF4233 domain-containing protein [Nigerium massiliense]